MILSILHDDFHFKAYKYHLWHKLEANDHEKRVKFAEWFLSLAPNVKFYFYFSDEAYFYLDPNSIPSKNLPKKKIEVMDLVVTSALAH